MEDLVVLGLAEPEQPRWGHIVYQFGINGGCGSYEDTDACNGRQCCKWSTNG